MEQVYNNEQINQSTCTMVHHNDHREDVHSIAWYRRKSYSIPRSSVCVHMKKTKKALLKANLPQRDQKIVQPVSSSLATATVFQEVQCVST